MTTKIKIIIEAKLNDDEQICGYEATVKTGKIKKHHFPSDTLEGASVKALEQLGKEFDETFFLSKVKKQIQKGS